MTALMWGSDMGHVETVKLLLDRGAEIDMQSSVSILITCSNIWTNARVYLCDGRSCHLISLLPVTTFQPLPMQSVAAVKIDSL